MILFDNVTKNFSGHSIALSDVTLSIDDGEFIFLIGPSGAGKTTLLRLLIRDLVPTKGTITIDDQDITKLPSTHVYLLRRKIGTVFQDFKLLMDRTVYENIALVPEILGKSNTDIHRAVHDVLELVGLHGKSDYFPLQLSAGEMQRTGIARAIIGGPRILLADEPTGNLDPETSKGILDTLTQIHSLGTTIIMATHNETIVNVMKKRTITLNHGKVIQDEAKGKYIHITRKPKKEKS